jgi:hypothetical protein
MDITLSEAPNLLSNRPVLTPALISVQAFFYFRGWQPMAKARMKQEKGRESKSGC